MAPDDGHVRVRQGLALIFQHSLARYDGVLEKAKNRNEKAEAKRERLIKAEKEVPPKLAPVSVTDGTGRDGPPDAAPGAQPLRR